MAARLPNPTVTSRCSSRRPARARCISTVSARRPGASPIPLRVSSRSVRTVRRRLSIRGRSHGPIRHGAVSSWASKCSTRCTSAHSREAGTWMAALEHLPALVDLGITTIEMMPVAEFAGRRGWGYDGVDLFAPTHLYGTPDDLRRFVDGAHALGLGVILDVVYNHLGPDGNFLREFSPAYFSTRYDNEWGDAHQLRRRRGRRCGSLFIANAGYWIDEFHMDGLRFDATQQIFDSSRAICWPRCPGAHTPQPADGRFC